MIIKYGDDDSQFVRICYPSKAEQTRPEPSRVAVIIHGGFWKAQYGIDTAAIESLAPFFVSKGFVAMEVEYRRVGNGGGYPATNEDILRALEVLSSDTSGWVDLSRVVLVGHSAGGHLALWACVERAAAPQGAWVPSLCIALAPVGDLKDGVARRLSDSGDAIQTYMGSEDVDSAAYMIADPVRRLPLPVPTLVVSGATDADVPPDYVDAFFHKCVTARQAGEGEAMRGATVTMLALKDTDHYQMVNAASPGWSQVYAMLESSVG